MRRTLMEFETVDAYAAWRTSLSDELHRCFDPPPAEVFRAER